MISRRNILETGAVVLAGFLCPRSTAAADNDTIIIQMRSDTQGSHVGFDPIGVIIQPGQTVRWMCTSNIHTATAYHPKNSQHSLRIPEGAEPWDSKYLFPGKTFEVKLTAEGVYDYFCLPHEISGMVGRIIVGKPTGPGALPFDYFENDSEKHGWRNVPKLAQEAFPSIADILKNGHVPLRMVSGSH